MGPKRRNVSAAEIEASKAKHLENKTTKPKRNSTTIEAIESDGDFEHPELAELDVNELDKIPDNRVSGFWHMSWLEVIARILFWAAIVYVNEKGFVNPHHPDFVFADYKFQKVAWDLYPNDKRSLDPTKNGFD